LRGETNIEEGRVRKAGNGPKWLEERCPDIQKQVREIMTEAPMEILKKFYQIHL